MPSMVSNTAFCALFLIFITALSICKAKSYGFTSTFDPIETNGVLGNFEMVIADGVGFYSWNLDLNSFIIPNAYENAGCTKEFIGSHGLKCTMILFIFHFVSKLFRPIDHIHDTCGLSSDSSSSCSTCIGTITMKFHVLHSFINTYAFFFIHRDHSV